MILGIIIMGILAIFFLVSWQFNFGFGVIGSIIVACMVFMFLIMAIPESYFIYKSEIKEFEAVKQTVETARANNESNKLESAAFQLKIAEMNQWLAKAQYWNSLWIIEDGFIPDDVDKLEPVR